jgi:hypothetical protein
MRDREIELISALVEGRLDDESEARALIASSVDLQAVYEAQKKAREALLAAGPVLMREDERAVLHRDVWTTLRTEATSPGTTSWYYRWVPITAGLVIVVVIGTAIIGGRADTVETAAIGASADSAATTMAASAGTTAASTERTTDEAMTGAFEADSPQAEDGAGEVDQLDTRLFADAARALRQEGTDLTLAPPSSTEMTIDLGMCLDEADLHDVDVIGTIDSASLSDISGISVPGDVSRAFIVAVPAGEDVETASFIFFVDSETCQLVYTGQ